MKTTGNEKILTCISSASRVCTLLLLWLFKMADKYIVSPGTYARLSVLQLTVIGPVAQQRQQTVFSPSQWTGLWRKQRN